jgi:formate C-acetyltransferase
MLDLPHDGLLSGALNLDVDTKQFEGEVGKAQFASMLAVYFNRGGLHAQVTCVGLDALIDAQNNPTEHKDLRVRVTGYSGVFVDICKRLQDDIIKRLK